MANQSTNGHPAEVQSDPALHLLREAEAVRELLTGGLGRLNALASLLRRQKKQARALMQAMRSLRDIPSDR